MRNVRVGIVALSLALVACVAVAGEPEDAALDAGTVGGSVTGGPAAAIEGTWLIDEITVISPRGEVTYPDPQPGIYIFADGYYSMVWSWAVQPMPDSEEIWRPSEEEKVRSFSSLIINSGTYTVSDTLVTTYPMVAKTPEFVGGMATYRYSVVADTLWMEVTNTVSHSGVVDPGIGKVRMPVKLVRP